jgi:antitoxin component HigA of HigAB toxin-antitoxin module
MAAWAQWFFPDQGYVETDTDYIQRATEMRFAIPSIPSALAFRQEQYGWTQRQMADKLGLQNSHYNEILKGKRKLPFEAACRAFKLGVPAKVLLALKNRRMVNG